MIERHWSHSRPIKKKGVNHYYPFFSMVYTDGRNVITGQSLVVDGGLVFH